MNRAQWLTRCATILSFALVTRPAAVQSVTVTVPTGVSFNVLNVSATTTGTPNPATVTFSSPLSFRSAQKLRMSVRADASTFAGPGTTRIAVSKASWTATAPTGTPSNGTLGSGAYVVVYLSPANLNSSTTESVSLRWTLASIAAAGLRSGTHTVTVRWKFEAF